MSTNQNEADSNRSINPEEASSFQKLVFNSVANATVTLIAEDEIQECGLNLQKRTYVKPDSDEAKGVEDLAIQLSELSLLHPIIVVDLDGEIFLVSGRKRLEAFRHSRANSSDKKIPCKVLVYQDLFKGLSWSEEEKMGQLQEALYNVSYSESAHNTQLSDETIIEFLRQIKANYGHSAELFEPVMKRLGLKRDNPAYRNIKRLWAVAANDTLYGAVENGLIQIGEAKKDDLCNQFLDQEKAKIIVERLEEYKRELAQEQGNDDGPIYNMSGYNKGRASGIISQSNPEPDEKNETYRVPDFDVRVDGTKVKVPTLDLDLSDNRRANIAKIVEFHYKLKKLVDDLESAIAAMKIEEAGGSASPISLNPRAVKAEPEYIQYIRDHNLHKYANSDRILEFYKELGRTLASEEELKKARKQADKGSLILMKFAKEDKIKSQITSS